ncbi:hypothetical protein INT48_003821 [Thamnidium elegans]|uniref:CAF17 C-terminal domain-containing protein n=1 Tax=Thamnidium elegans TaxID=101142 RepID=A0A8H7SXS8_9FUNG|nr:hypothetical protein INT48_003821 [Thamnidium elegans]
MLSKLIPCTNAFKQPILKQALARSFASTTSFQFKEKDELHKGDHYSKIPNRSLIELDGPDTPKFLQGLITNDMAKISTGGDGLYASFLTPPGRILHDTFIYPVNVGVNFPHPKFMIDCPSNNKDLFIRHIKRYLLRSKVKVRDCSEEYQLWNVWGNALNTEVLDPALVKKEKRFSDIGCTDPRIAGFGYRAVLKADSDVQHILPKSADFEELDASEYTIRRLLFGLPEGTDDLWPELSLPLESNFDYMNGVDFRKGCYVGQELTIRTYHTGVVRKRIVPIQVYDPSEPAPSVQTVDRSKQFPSVLLPQTDIKLVQGTSKRGVGKMCSGVHNIGLALMRLEHVQKCIDGQDVEFTTPEDPSIRIRPFLPEWWGEDRKNVQHE